MQENQIPTPDTEPTEQPNRFEEESRQAKAATRRLKRNMLIVIGAMVAFIAIALPIVTLLEDKQEEGKETVPQGKPSNPGTIIFFPPEYDVDILKDPAYLEMDRAIYLSDGVVTVELTPDQLKNNNPAVGVLARFVDSLIRGDAETYNSLFSERYYANPNNLPEEEYPMQRVYDIVIEKIREQVVTTKEGERYTEYTYKLEYKISRNSGTYRTDIGEGESRPQYFCLTDRTKVNGEPVVLIDTLVYMSYAD